MNPTLQETRPTFAGNHLLSGLPERRPRICTGHCLSFFQSGAHTYDDRVKPDDPYGRASQLGQVQMQAILHLQSGSTQARPRKGASALPNPESCLAHKNEPRWWHCRTVTQSGRSLLWKTEETCVRLPSVLFTHAIFDGVGTVLDMVRLLMYHVCVCRCQGLLVEVAG